MSILFALAEMLLSTMSAIDVDKLYPKLLYELIVDLGLGIADSALY
jgi:hypothetical protein